MYVVVTVGWRPMRRTFPSVSDRQPVNILDTFVTLLVSISGTVVSSVQSENMSRMFVTLLVSISGTVVSDTQPENMPRTDPRPTSTMSNGISVTVV